MEDLNCRNNVICGRVSHGQLQSQQNPIVPYSTTNMEDTCKGSQATNIEDTWKNAHQDYLLHPVSDSGSLEPTLGQCAQTAD